MTWRRLEHNPSPYRMDSKVLCCFMNPLNHWRLTPSRHHFLVIGWSLWFKTAIASAIVLMPGLSRQSPLLASKQAALTISRSSEEVKNVGRPFFRTIRKWLSQSRRTMVGDSMKSNFLIRSCSQRLRSLSTINRPRLALQTSGNLSLIHI